MPIRPSPCSAWIRKAKPVVRRLKRPPVSAKWDPSVAGAPSTCRPWWLCATTHRYGPWASDSVRKVAPANTSWLQRCANYCARSSEWLKAASLSIHTGPTLLLLATFRRLYEGHTRYFLGVLRSLPDEQNASYRIYEGRFWGPRPFLSAPPPHPPSGRQPPGERAHPARRPAASMRKNTFDFQDRISGAGYCQDA